MIDPFSTWTRLLAANAAMASASFRAAETMTAAASVIDRRTTIMRSAVADPLRADHAEIGRMVPEKISAFAAAGQALMGGWLAWQKALETETRALGAVTMRGRPPTPGEWMTLAARSAEFGVAAAELTARTGAAALAPVHAAATANARRLGRKRG